MVNVNIGCSFLGGLEWRFPLTLHDFNPQGGRKERSHGRLEKCRKEAKSGDTENNTCFVAVGRKALFLVCETSSNGMVSIVIVYRSINVVYLHGQKNPLIFAMPKDEEIEQ